ncbi:carbohydrate-binding protein [Microbacterium marmarense]|uniref:Carbohydrate-binding protein n=1 Tax=Microbacterium marmarense TaxID=3122051 RepID=A0ABU8LR83_9MICO
MSCIATAALTLAAAAVPLSAASAVEADLLIYAAPNGGDSAAGTANDPASITRARDLVRASNDAMSADIQVILADGTYRLAETLELTEEDSGTNGFRVRWTAADGASPVLSGSDAVTGWTLDSDTGIYSAPVAEDAESRNLYVNGTSAVRAQTRFTRPAQSAFIAEGLQMTSNMGFLSTLTPAELAHVEIRGVNSFTDRYSRVDSLSADGATLVMVNPAWKNNTWGWDTLKTPFHESGFYAENALAFLDASDEWFLDTEADLLYYKPAASVDMATAAIELPRLETIFSISGSSADSQAHDISISGVTFSGSTWNTPTETGGYVDQQTGGYLSVGEDYPEDDYPGGFESTRPDWKQVPSAVQISAATDVSIDGSHFVGLGASGLGIGNDATAHDSGVGLATQRISVTASTFTEIGSNALTIGGIEQQAHHPGTLDDGTRDPAVSDATVDRMTVSEITVSQNRIWDAADTYTSAVGILMTYTADSVIEHNDVTDMPYGAINTGYGWGANDVGGSSDYAERGLYDYQPVFTTPTVAKNNLITANYTARYGLKHTDLGGFYNLSANPGSVWSENYIVEPRNRAFYPDEGSRDLTFNNNVAINGDWWGANFRAPNTANLSGSGNWISEGNTIVRGNRNTLVEATTFTPSDVVSCEITNIRYNAGVSAELRPSGDASRPGSACLDTSAEVVSGQTIVTASFEDLAADHTGLTLSATAPSGWSATSLDDVPATLPLGTAAVQRWSIATPAQLTDAIDTADIAVQVNSDSVAASEIATVSVGGTIRAPFLSTGNGAYLAGQKGDEFALWEAGADMWGVNQSDDDFAAIYAEDSFGDGTTMTAKVTSHDRVNDWTKSGLVIRNDVSQARSAGGYAILVVTPAKGVIFSVDRDNNGLLDRNTTVGGVTAPVSLQLVRNGDVVQAKYSKDDGATWTAIGSETLTTADAKQDAGLVHVSHDVSVYGRADFTNFSITPDVPAGVLQSLEVVASPSSVVAGDAVEFAVSGEDNYGNAMAVDGEDVVVSSNVGSDVITGTTATVTEAGTHTFTATVNGVSETVDVEVVAADLASLSVEASSASVDQGESVSLTVSGSDEHGNAVLVDGEDVTVSSDVATDAIDGLTVSFTDAGTHMLTATVAGISASVSVEVATVDTTPVDTERPVVVLVSPSTAGPFQELSVKVDATDNAGLHRVVANIYKDGLLVKSTQSVADGATEFSHSATVSLPDGSYSMKYNASDVAGNISSTGVVSFTIDATVPTVTVKSGDEFTIGDAASGYEKLSLKLFDAGLVDRVEINGTVKDLTNAKWSDVNGIVPGTFGAVLGENTVVVFDVAGNATTLTFTLVEPAPAAPVWDASVVYNTGDEVTYNGATYVAQWWTRNSEPGTSTTGSWMQQGDLVPAAGTGVREWTASWVYTGGEVVAHNGHVWKAKWWTRNATPGASVWQDLGSY